jgi:carbonic anhydrase
MKWPVAVVSLLLVTLSLPTCLTQTPTPGTRLQYPVGALWFRALETGAAGGAVCLAPTGKAWVQVDLGASPMAVGFIRVSGSVTRFLVEFSDAAVGAEFTPLADPATREARELAGNTLVAVAPGKARRYIRVLPTVWTGGRVCLTGSPELFAPSGVTAAVPWAAVTELGPAYGLASGRIPQDAILARDYHRSDSCLPDRVRPNSGDNRAWCAKEAKPLVDGSKPSWIEVDLGVASMVAGLELQGRTKADQWVTLFKVRVSLNDEDWTYVNAENPRFRGNYDASTPLRLAFPGGPVEARYVRIEPLSWKAWPSLRLELFAPVGAKVPATYTRPKIVGPSLGLAFGGRLPTDAFTSSGSFASSDCAPHDSRLNAPNKDAWCAVSADEIGRAYVQVDLGTETEVGGVALQGRPESSQWVSVFKIDYSSDLSKPFTAGPNPLVGVTDDDATVVRAFDTPFKARYVRLTPLSFRGFPALRWDLFAPVGAKEPGPYARPDVLGPALGAGAGGRLPADAFMASSSYPSANTTPWAGRLNLGGGSAWCAGKVDVSQWLEVDLGEPTMVGGVALQGRDGVSQWTTTVKVVYSEKSDEGPWMDAFASATADFDNDGPQTLVAAKPFKARYVRFTPLAWVGHPCLRVELYAPLGAKAPAEYIRPDVVGPALGLSSGRVPAEAITASSTFRDDNCSPNRARLNVGSGTSAWCADTKADVAKEYLEVDLGSPTVVGGVATQGRLNVAQWVTSYRVAVSTDGYAWNVVKDAKSGADRVFAGNHDSKIPRVHAISPAVKARYVRIVPLTFFGWPSMRVELYGALGDKPLDKYVHEDKLGPALGLASERIPDYALRASSFAPNGEARRARLSGTKGIGAWCALNNEASAWVQVDLGNSTYVSGVGTQGKAWDSEFESRKAGYVTEYSVAHSEDGSAWKVVPESFGGNADTSEIVRRNAFKDGPVLARYVRLMPKNYKVRMCLRFEVYAAIGAVTAKYAVDMEKVPTHQIDGNKYRFRDDRSPADTSSDFNKPAAANPFETAALAAPRVVDGVLRTGPGAPAPWSYDNQASWGELRPEWKQCSTNKRQSPIDLSSALRTETGSSDLKFLVTSVDFGKIRYKFTGATWHSPSEHLVDGVQAPLEVQLLYESQNDFKDIDGDSLTVSILFLYGRENAKLKAKQESTKIFLPSDYLPPSGLSGGFFLYRGSLTTPPCTPAHTVVLQHLNEIDADQAKLFNPVGARDQQPLDGRKVQRFEK